MPSGWEWAILVLIALLLLGGARLPGIGRKAGRAVRTVRDGLSSLGGGAAPDEPAGPVAEPVTGPVTPASPDEPERG